MPPFFPLSDYDRCFSRRRPFIIGNILYASLVLLLFLNDITYFVYILGGLSFSLKVFNIFLLLVFMSTHMDSVHEEILRMTIMILAIRQYLKSKLPLLSFLKKYLKILMIMGMAVQKLHMSLSFHTLSIPLTPHILHKQFISTAFTFWCY